MTGRMHRCRYSGGRGFRPLKVELGHRLGHLLATSIRHLVVRVSRHRVAEEGRVLKLAVPDQLRVKAVCQSFPSLVQRLLQFFRSFVRCNFGGKIDPPYIY